MFLFFDNISRKKTDEKIIYSVLQTSNIGFYLLGFIICIIISVVLFLELASLQSFNFQLFIIFMLSAVMVIFLGYLIYTALQNFSSPFLEIDILYGKILYKGNEVNLEKFQFIQESRINSMLAITNNGQQYSNAVFMHNQSQKISKSEAKNYFQSFKPLKKGFKCILLKRTYSRFTTRKIAKDCAEYTPVIYL